MQGNSLSTRFNHFILEPRYWWGRHLIFWAYRHNHTSFGLLGIMDLGVRSANELFFQILLPDLLLAYINLWLLVPKFLMKRKFTWYLISVVSCLAFYVAYLHFFAPLDNYESDYSLYYNLYFNDFRYGLELILIMTGARLILEYFYTQTRLAAAQNETMRSELALLKNQISPHFLFNTLNNITVLSEKYPEKVTEAIISLSKILRYQLYQSDKETVPLKNEIENLRKYLALESIRLNHATTSLTISERPGDLHVSPFLFLPFLENAIKYSADPNNPSFITIRFEIKQNQIIFTAINSKPKTPSKKLQGGIGLQNVKRRLELLYPGKHQLTVSETPNDFTAILILNIQNT